MLFEHKYLPIIIFRDDIMFAISALNTSQEVFEMFLKSILLESAGNWGGGVRRNGYTARID